MLYYIIAALYVIVCLSLMLVVLLQQGKGGDIANAFGGGTSQAAFGARSGATVLSRATAIGAALFMVGAVLLGVLGQKGPSSVLGTIKVPVAPVKQAAPAKPAAPATAPAATPAAAPEATPAAAPAAEPKK